MKKFSLTDVIISIVAAELVGAAAALLSGSFRDFYSELVKPPLAPPHAVFPVVWAILYALMGISAYIIYASYDSSTERSTALGLYVTQLAVNFSWTLIFFRFRLIGAAMFVAILLFILVLAMILSFRKVRPIAAWLNVPYLVWALFAAYLSVGFSILN
jgi:tryptophan-rich sensory protein